MNRRGCIWLVMGLGVVVGGCNSPKNIWKAAEKGDVKTVEDFLSHGISVDEAFSGRIDEENQFSGNLLEPGWTPLHFASREGNLSVVDFLISEGANVNATAKNSKSPITPLHLAALHGRKRVVAALVKAGANLEAKAHRKGTPLHYAIYGITEISEQSTDVTGEKRAAHDNCRAIIRFLVKKGADIEAEHSCFGPSLKVVLYYGDRGLFDLFLELGADINNARGGVRGGTSLHMAVSYNKKDMISFLLKRNADIEAKDKSGGTPLHRAARSRQSKADIIQLLLAKGAAINAEDKDGKTPLDMAIKVNNEDCATILRKHGGKKGEELKAEKK